jgi:hypothetical protein
MRFSACLLRPKLVNYVRQDQLNAHLKGHSHQRAPILTLPMKTPRVEEKDTGITLSIVCSERMSVPIIILRAIAVLVISASSVGLVAAAIDESQFAPGDIIAKDVAVIGGGASGAHAAIILRDDYHKSVVLVEKDFQLVHRVL